tara:strand:+ start:481 stop:648 length:168 start_codon:yes stop_codon:yes gene_type:complete
MVKKWRVESSNTMVEIYIIEADTEAEARDIWGSSNVSPVAIEHHEETIDSIIEER